MFCSDYPRGLVNCFWLWWFPASNPLPVAPVLSGPSLFACPRRPVSLLRLPPRPFPRCLPAALATIALACLPGMKALLASFEQTAPHARPACQSLPPASRLIFGMDCRTLGRAHGRWWLPEAPALEGIHSPPGRKPPAQLRINTV